MEEIYHGRTQLGVGQHELIKKKLEEERHKDYQDHIARLNRKQAGHYAGGDADDFMGGSSSVADIGYRTSQNIAQQRKQLSEARKAEYTALLASQAAGTHHGHRSEEATEEVVPEPVEEAEPVPEMYNSFQRTAVEEEKEKDDRKQKQRDYADALLEQIAEKKRHTECQKRKDKETDLRNMEISHDRHGQGHFICGAQYGIEEPESTE